MSSERLPDDYFDALYAGNADPWGFHARWYEQRKRALTLALLPRPRFASAFEPGCSVGLLSEGLAGRCDRLLATDISSVALAAAEKRLAGHDHVRVARWALGGAWPQESFDLVVLSEVLYYLGRPLLEQVVVEATAALRPDGVLLAVHWRHPVEDYPLGGDEVHAALAAAPGLSRTAGYRDDDFLADCFARVPPPMSVAAREGLV